MMPSPVRDQECLAFSDELLENLRALVQIGLARRGMTDPLVVAQMRLGVCSLANDPDGRVLFDTPA